MDAVDDISAIIMAGGRGARFGSSVPKVIVPLPDGSTLLTRLLSQLAEARIRTARICCSPESFPEIHRLVEQTLASSSQSKIEIQTITCIQCAFGPLPALAEALAGTTGEWRLLCLGDIYFSAVSFREVARHAEMNPSGDGWILTGHDLCGRDEKAAGWLQCNGSKLCDISYSPSPTANLRWTGGFLFRKELVSDLLARIQDYSHKPLEAWIHDLILAGRELRTFDAGGFINVNSPDDYLSVLRIAGPLIPTRDHNAIGAFTS